MATYPAGLYIVITPIAAAFAGFGSLASGIGQRHGGDDARVDAFRLTTMLFSSLSATLLGLLPADAREPVARRWHGGACLRARRAGGDLRSTSRSAFRAHASFAQWPD